MRGTPLVNVLAVPTFGIIPAYAGNTLPANCSRKSRKDHPRVCGEHPQDGGNPIALQGSSPRMRGTHRLETPCVQSDGIIPAYAGNTNLCPSMASMLRDHPRVCGEHGMADIGDAFNSGSSPRMRGTPYSPYPTARCTGIIPAYAGNTTSPVRVTSSLRDHPRVCGEHSYAVEAMRSGQGSSPRMRGTQSSLQWDAVEAGIIPAYAGNTESWNYAPPSPRDHPRVCGEHLCSKCNASFMTGSSPRMRGTRPMCCLMKPSYGIIPAYAGNTRAPEQPVSQQRDHPRVCGEHLRCQGCHLV